MNGKPSSSWLDNGQRYGRLTRLLHWTMALLLAWQFTGMAVRLIVGRAPITAFWVGTHVPIGILLLLLVSVRLASAFAQRQHRPRQEATLVGRAAAAGHVTLYALMLVVPVLSFTRHLAAGRPVILFGHTLVAGGGEPREWLMAPADALHGPLAWLLLALIVGHVAMVVVHRFVWRDDTLSRMAGRAVRQDVRRNVDADAKP